MSGIVLYVSGLPREFLSGITAGRIDGFLPVCGCIVYHACNYHSKLIKDNIILFLADSYVRPYQNIQSVSHVTTKQVVLLLMC